MKKTSTYEERARKFATNVLTRLFEGCEYLDDFVYAIEYYNAHHFRKLKYDSGVSRIAIIRADYVVKFNYRPTGSFSDGRAGDCESEQKVYARALEDGMAHLLAKTTVLTVNGLTFSIMPRIKGIGRDWHWWEHCTREEEEWLEDNLYDLHRYNVGYRKGKVCVIDYAWDANRIEDESDSSSYYTDFSSSLTTTSSNCSSEEYSPIVWFW